jgi:hypothetical protein
MDGAIYNRAVERIAQLQAELQRLETFVCTYRELAGAVEATPSEQSNPAARIVPTAVPGSEPSVVYEPGEKPRAAPQAELERVVTEVLVNNGAPLQRMELFNRVKALGVVIGGTNEITNFGSKLSRSDQLVNLPKLGYWPKDRPFEPAGFVPNRADQALAA